MADWITGFIESHGYWAIAALMALENVLPPIPSELIMPFAGFHAAQGALDPALVVAAGAAGSLAGTLPWYWLGQRLGQRRLEHLAERHGRWLTVSRDEVERATRWFERHDARAVFGGRLVPAVRSVISAPAGVARMALPRFLLWSAAGTLIWCSALAGAGFTLGERHEAAARWIAPVSETILVAALAAWLWRVLRRR